MDKFDAIRLFVRIVERGSFSMAGKDLGFPRSSDEPIFFDKSFIRQPELPPDLETEIVKCSDQVKSLPKIGRTSIARTSRSCA
jgi:hypothetical protein